VKTEELKAAEVIEAYKNQNASIERGFRFLKSPEFFVSSFYVKRVSRIMGLLMIMTLSLLIYSLMQRELRKQLEEQGESLPNQIKKEIKNPTMRWLFQLMEGIDVIYIQNKDKIEKQIMGMSPLKAKIISLLYPPIAGIYSTA
jgi:transposase